MINMNKEKRKKRFRLIFMFIIVLSIIISSSPLSISSDEWSDSWEFEYEEQPTNPIYKTQDFTAYATLYFNGTASTTQNLVFHDYATLTFNGSAEVEQGTTITDISPGTWTGGTPSLDSSITENFTYYQNGTATIDINISFNDTNYTFVSYATWIANGHNQWCANFTTDLWSTETNIAPGYPPTTTLNSSVPGDTSFPFGIRIWMPKTMDYQRQEDFVLVTTNTTS